jgi:hypothetical protein
LGYPRLSSLDPSRLCLRPLRMLMSPRSKSSYPLWYILRII